MPRLERLQQGLSALSLSFTPAQLQRCLRYVELLEKWNKAYNLSAIRDPMAMIDRHVLDSASILPMWFESSFLRVIDVGTGAGLPGIIMAIAKPEASITLLDSNGKKTRFLFQAVNDLGLKNVQIENLRVESFHSSEKFDMVISRAYASLLDMVTSTAHLVAGQGQWWAMKGVYPKDEIASLPTSVQLATSHELSPPFCEGERHLVCLNQQEG